MLPGIRNGSSINLKCGDLWSWENKIKHKIACLINSLTTKPRNDFSCNQLQIVLWSPIACTKLLFSRALCLMMLPSHLNHRACEVELYGKLNIHQAVPFFTANYSYHKPFSSSWNTGFSKAMKKMRYTEWDLPFQFQSHIDTGFSIHSKESWKCYLTPLTAL